MWCNAQSPTQPTRWSSTLNCDGAIGPELTFGCLFTTDSRKSNYSGVILVNSEYIPSHFVSTCRSSAMSVLYAPLWWRRWNNGHIQNRLTTFFLLFKLHATNEIVIAEAAADNNNNSSSLDILDVM